ncbi:MAG: threonine synthase [Gemmatimonadetes bacterium]|nr:threonine synthase [Gemmatimonadota bacterium]
MTEAIWTLHCSACSYTASGDGLASVCPDCGLPLMVKHRPAAMASVTTEPTMWRYSDTMPIRDGEVRVSLGEGMTPLIEVPEFAAHAGVGRVWIKDEGSNPTASFKARGLCMAVTRAKALGLKGLCVPTAGNAGIALAAYAAAARMPARIYAPQTTPPPILGSIRAYGAELVLVDGHIGDAGKATKAFATESGYFNVATVREPYRVEGMKTMGYEIAEAFGWRDLPDALVYPTGGGEGTIGIWKAFQEMIEWGWLAADVRLPKMIVAQASGCAPLVRAFTAGADHATPWENPATHASGLRVPGPFGDRLVLRTLKDSNGGAFAVDEDTMRADTLRLASTCGIDAAPEGGCALAVAGMLASAGLVDPDARVVVFNTGSGASYRW